MARKSTSRTDPRRNALKDDFYDGNDDHIDALKELLEMYRGLHDQLSDMIEGGRLEEEHIPDDYQALVTNLAELAAHPDNSDNEPKED